MQKVSPMDEELIGSEESQEIPDEEDDLLDDAPEEETEEQEAEQPKVQPKELNEKRLIEAALFISARSLNLEELRTLTGIGALGYLQSMLTELKKEYEERGSAVEIIDINGKYEMKVKNDYMSRVKQFAQDIEISKSSLRTLAYIAKHDGVLKSTVVKRIGTQVYHDVKELVEAEFVKSQKAGRSAKLFLTDKFKKYFEQK